MWLLEEVKARATGGCDQGKQPVREARPPAPTQPAARFETPPARQAQVEFAEFRLPWRKRRALPVVPGNSCRMWLRCYRQQTMMVVIRGLEESFRR